MDRDEDPTIWCGSLAQDVTEELLYELFLQAGPVSRVTIPKDKDGRRRNFGFVTFKHAISIPYALELFKDVCLFNEPVRLKNRSGVPNPDNRLLLAQFSQSPNSPGNFGDVRNGYNIRGNWNEQFENRRQDPFADNQRNRNYDIRENEMHGRRAGNRYGRVSSQVDSWEANQREPRGNERIQRDGFGGDRGHPRDLRGNERSHRDAYNGERFHRDPYGGERSQYESYGRERIKQDAPSPWMGRSGRDRLTSSISWPPTPPGLSNISLDGSPLFSDNLQKNQPSRRTKMVLPQPTQQTFMINAGITQMNAYFPRDK